MSEDKTVVNINKSGWCAFCCSNFCYCSKDNLMRQLSNTLAAIKDRNEELDSLRARLAEAEFTLKRIAAEPDVEATQGLCETRETARAYLAKYAKIGGEGE